MRTPCAPGTPRHVVLHVLRILYDVEAAWSGAQVYRTAHITQKLGWEPRRSLCTHPQKYSLASMACQSVDSYRSHHKKQRTRAVMGACQPRLAVLPATSGSWALPLRSCRQRHFHIGLGQANSPRLDRLQPWPPSLGLALSFFPDSLTLTSVLACREPQCN